MLHILENWWVIYVVISLVVFILIGMSRFRSGKERAIKVFGDKVLLFLSFLFSVLFALLLLVESWDGIVSYFDRLLFAGSLVWPSICTVVTILAAAFLFGTVLYVIGAIVSFVKKAKIDEAIRERRRMEAMEEMAKKDDSRTNSPE